MNSFPFISFGELGKVSYGNDLLAFSINTSIFIYKCSNFQSLDFVSSFEIESKCDYLVISESPYSVLLKPYILAKSNQKLYFYDTISHEIFSFSYPAKSIYFDNCFDCSIFIVTNENHLVHCSLSLNGKNIFYSIDWDIDLEGECEKFVLSSDDNNIGLILYKNGDLFMYKREWKNEIMKKYSFGQLLEYEPILDISSTKMMDIFIASSPNYIHLLNPHTCSVITVVNEKPNFGYFIKGFGNLQFDKNIIVQVSNDSFSLYSLEENNFVLNDNFNFDDDIEVNTIVQHDNAISIITNNFNILNLCVKNKKIVIDSLVEIPILSDTLGYTEDFGKVAYLNMNNFLCITNKNKQTILNYSFGQVNDMFWFSNDTLIVYSNNKLQKVQIKDKNILVSNIFANDVKYYNYIKNDSIISVTNDLINIYSIRNEAIQTFFYSGVNACALSRDNNESLIIALSIGSGLIFFNQNFEKIDFSFEQSSLFPLTKLFFCYPIIYAIDNSNYLYSYNYETKEKISYMKITSLNSYCIFGQDFYYSNKTSVIKVDQSLNKTTLLTENSVKLVYVDDKVIKYSTQNIGIFIYSIIKEPIKFFEKSIKSHFVPIYFDEDQFEFHRNYLYQIINSAKNTINDLEFIYNLLNFDIPVKDPSVYKDIKQIYLNIIFTLNPNFLSEDEIKSIKKYIQQYISIQNYFIAGALLNLIGEKKACAEILMKSNYIEIGYIYCLINKIDISEFNILKNLIDSMIKKGKIIQAIHILFKFGYNYIGISLLYEKELFKNMKDNINKLNFIDYKENQNEKELVSFLNLSLKPINDLVKLSSFIESFN